jgi:hypothetical protein
VSGESPSYRIEEDDAGRVLVVTGRWTREAALVVERGEVDGLTLNYALGFSHPNIEFLDAWPIRRLRILDRGLTNLEPVARLRETLEDLSVQAAAEAELDLGEAPRLRALTGEWELIRWQLRLLDSLERLITWRFDETSLLALSDHTQLQQLTIKEPRKLESLVGAENFRSLRHLELTPAPWLTDMSAIDDLTGLDRLILEGARSLATIDHVSPHTNLRHLAIADSGEIESLSPIRGLTRLQSLYLWGTTRILDADLTPVLGLSALTDFRMRPRKVYRPLVADVMGRLGIVH